MTAGAGQEVLLSIYIFASIGAFLVLCLVLLSRRSYNELPEDIEANL